MRDWLISGDLRMMAFHYYNIYLIQMSLATVYIMYLRQKLLKTDAKSVLGGASKAISINSRSNKTKDYRRVSQKSIPKLSRRGDRPGMM